MKIQMKVNYPNALMKSYGVKRQYLSTTKTLVTVLVVQETLRPTMKLCSTL